MGLGLCHPQIYTQKNWCAPQKLDGLTSDIDFVDMAHYAVKGKESRKVLEVWNIIHIFARFSSGRKTLVKFY